MGSARGPACCGIGSFCRGDDSEGHATFPFGHLGWGAAWSLQACPLRGVYGTHSFGFVPGPEWCVLVCRVSGCGYGGAPMRGPGFVCGVGDFGPSCLPPSCSETCCRGRVYRAGPPIAADFIQWSCCGRVCGAGFVLSNDSIRWSCCGRSYGASSFLAPALIRWSCCGRSYGAGPFLAVALREGASSKVLISTRRPGLWWSATGRRGWPHGACVHGEYGPVREVLGPCYGALPGLAYCRWVCTILDSSRRLSIGRVPDMFCFLPRSL